MRTVIYLDDILILAENREELVFQVCQMTTLLEQLGFTINIRKSLLEPARLLTYLGVVVNLITMKFLLTEEKLQQLSDISKTGSSSTEGFSPSLIPTSLQSVVLMPRGNINLLIGCLPGRENSTADQKSRELGSPAEWMLHKEVFQPQQILGPCSFAATINCNSTTNSSDTGDEAILQSG